VITDRLLEKGQKLRLIARDGSKLKKFVDKGAEAQTGSLDDVNFLTKAFSGATAVFAMIPANFTVKNLAEHYDHFGEAITKALQNSGASRILHLSSVGAEHPSGTGPITGLHRQEQRLNKLSANVLHLRPTYFMENLLGNIPIIKNMGINGASFRADLKIPMIATRDIGEDGANCLLNWNVNGKTERLLLGQRDLTMSEVTTILGKAIGKSDLKYVQFGYEDAEKGMIGAGISPDLAKNFIEMTKAFNDGVIRFERTKENTTPTPIEEFAKVFSTIYQSQ
ncbi:MAG: hypothetical protein C5B54_07395, partial [Acidobacteria bacterium]